MTIVPLAEDKVEEVVRLHQKVLGDTLNAQVGFWFLVYLYRTLLAYPQLATILVAQEDNHIIGFISVTKDYARLSTILMTQLSIRQKLIVIVFLFTHPKLLLEFNKQRSFGQYIQQHLPSPLPYVLTLGVDLNQQGKGVGRLLMDAVVAHHPTLYLDTKTNNTSALRFYERYGFQELDRRFGNVMLKLAPDE